MKLYRALMNGDEIARRVSFANNFMKRLTGLLFKKEIDEEEGLLISPCSQVHTIGMKFSIDLVFLSKCGEVIGIEPSVSPGKISPLFRKCHQVLELKSEMIEKKGIIKGSQITFKKILFNTCRNKKMGEFKWKKRLV